jgi:hypothetical protein
MQMGKVKYSYREIDPHDLQLGALLGEGGFGKGVRFLSQGQDFAAQI